MTSFRPTKSGSFTLIRLRSARAATVMPCLAAIAESVLTGFHLGHFGHFDFTFAAPAITFGVFEYAAAAFGVE